jgi:glycogen(starch) synthase
MLGWELPPYNSGGLGTACLGLTEALTPLGVSIRFVVPKLFGALPYSHMDVISAADYASPDEMLKLLSLSKTEEDYITHTLAYGNHLTVDEQRRVWVEQLGAAAPVSPHTQATWYAQQATAIAQNETYDLIHCHDWMTYYGGIAAKEVAHRKGADVPFVAQVHATEIDRCGENGNPAIIAIEKRGLHQADEVVAVSHYTKEMIHRHYEVPRAKISVVHNGIPADRQPARYDLHELKKHHKIVLFMGRITMQKGPDYFVKLAKSVTDRDPSVLFVLVGSGDMERRCIEESARQGLTGKILFSTFLRGEDVDRAYQLADLFVMPSVSEPFGIVALEAIQNGTPALVSNQSGVAEVSEHLIKVDFWDIEKMADSVLKVLQDPAYASHLRQGGFEDLKNLSWNHSAEKMQSVYNHLLTRFATQPRPLHA